MWLPLYPFKFKMHYAWRTEMQFLEYLSTISSHFLTRRPFSCDRQCESRDIWIIIWREGTQVNFLQFLSFTRIIISERNRVCLFIITPIRSLHQNFLGCWKRFSSRVSHYRSFFRYRDFHSNLDITNSGSVNTMIW